jgi:NAD(P)-dependent dehydrogenase (short-subunit alcohol dehydrogenase family)
VNERYEDRRVLVTGGSLGIGLAVSAELARRGARLIVAARHAEAIDAALGELDGGGHTGLVLDVSDEHAWSQAAAQIDAGGELHGLVTAAGILGPIGALEELPVAELTRAIGVNLIGTMLALRFALPRLRAGGGRAVTFSGGGASSPLPRYDAYAASKAAVVRLTENVAAAGGIEVNCVAPGFVSTRMHDQTLSAGPDAAGARYYERTRAELAEGGFPAAEAAELVCFLLSDQARGISGRLLSAQWDPWREEEFRARLRTDDSLATLRRIDEQFFTRVEP